LDYWDDIEEMPVWNYHKASTTGDLKYMAKGDGAIDKRKALDAFDKVRQQYYDTYGMDYTLREYYNNLKRVTELKAKLVETGERFLINEIRIKEREIEDFENQKGISHSQIYASISKYMGYRFNPKTESVVSYKEALNMIERESEQMKKTNKDG